MIETAEDAGTSLLAEVDLPAALEALLIIAADPMTELDLAQATGSALSEVIAGLHSLADQYQADRRGFELRKVGEGWRFYSATRCAEVVRAWVADPRGARLSQAALETVAVIAYRQPVSRAQVGAIRGVNVDGVVRTLLAHDLVWQTGEDPLSGAALYRTTDHFLELMGMASLSELPSIVDLLPDPQDVTEHVDGEALDLP